MAFMDKAPQQIKDQIAAMILPTNHYLADVVYIARHDGNRYILFTDSTYMTVSIVGINL